MAHPIIEALEQRYTVDPEVLRALEVMLRERDAAIQTQWSAQSVLLDVDSATLCLSAERHSVAESTSSKTD